MVLDHQHILLSIWIVAIAWSESRDRVPVAAETKQPPKGSIIARLALRSKIKINNNIIIGIVPQLVQMSQAADKRGNGQGMNGHGERVTLTFVVVVVEFYLKSQHKQAMAPSFIHASD